MSSSVGSLKRLIQDFFKAHDARLTTVEGGLSVDLRDPKAKKASAKTSPKDGEESADSKAPETDTKLEEQSEDIAAEAKEESLEEDNSEEESSADNSAEEKAEAEAKQGEEAAEVDTDLGKLRELFGRDQLHLVFDTKEVPEGSDLVVEGGHILRVIEDFLTERGAKVYVEQPAQHRLTKSLLNEQFTLADSVAIGSIQRENLDCWDFYFLFKIHFKGRTRKDTLLSVQVESRAGKVDKIAMKNAPRNIQDWVWKKRKQPPLPILEEAHRRACAFMESKTSLDALEFQKESRALIDKDILRIKSFYGGQIKELWGNKTPTDKARTKIVDLEEEQARKVKERLNAIQVNVEVETSQLMMVELPVQKAAIQITKGSVSGEFSLAFNRATGTLDRPLCTNCEKELKEVDLCRSAHLSCSKCMVSCRCGTDVCGTCGHEACSVCQKETCTLCLEECGHCGESNCLDHHRTCDGCSSPRCLTCARACQSCEKTVCLSCGLLSKVGELGETCYCRDCGTKCQSCDSLLALSDLNRCEVCGRRFCSACLDIEKNCRFCLLPSDSNAPESEAPGDTASDSNSAS